MDAWWRGLDLPGAGLAFALTTLLLLFLQPVAARFKLVDRPDHGRKDHKRPTPVTGGIAILAACLAVFYGHQHGTPQLEALTVGALLLAVVGIYDDLHDLRWYWRILTQVVAALLMIYWGGVRIEQLGPVFGLGETSMMVACMYGQRFSGVAFHGKQAQYYDRKAFEYGLASRHVPFGDLGIDFTQVQKAFVDPGQMTECFVAETRRLAKQGAEVVLAACATVNAIIRRENIREVDGTLVMDCNAVLLKLAEAMAELSQSAGLRASQRLLYQRPDRRSLGEWMKTYGFRSGPQPRP